MTHTALLIVDMQEAVITGTMYREAEVLSNMRTLLDACRAAHVEVIYVRHDYGEGHEFARETASWQIYHELAPLAEERIFDKHRNSAFYHTGLEAYLRTQGIVRLILIGVHTEYCIDATCKSAFERDFEVIIPELTNTTEGNLFLDAETTYLFYNQGMWHRRYATLLPLTDVIMNL